MVSKIIWKYLSHSNDCRKWPYFKKQYSVWLWKSVSCTATDLLRENGYDIPENTMEALRMLKDLSENDYEVIDVKRKKDLQEVRKW